MCYFLFTLELKAFSFSLSVVTMLTRPLTLNDSEDSGRALVMHPASRLVDGGEDDDEIQTGEC